jgi:hypothetical protein
MCWLAKGAHDEEYLDLWRGPAAERVSRSLSAGLADLPRAPEFGVIDFPFCRRPSMVRNARFEQSVFGVIALIMLVTRSHSLSQVLHLPDTSLASFFVLGFFVPQVLGSCSASRSMSSSSTGSASPTSVSHRPTGCLFRLMV